MVLAAAIGFALFPSPVIGTTPEATIRSVVEALNDRNIDVLLGSFEIVSPKASGVLKELLKAPRPNPDLKYSVDSVSVGDSGDRATAKVKIKFITTPSQSLGEESVLLIKKDGNWKIDNRESPTKPRPGLFTSLGEFLKNPGSATANATAASEATVILSNMKQLALGAILYATDQDDKLNLSTATLKTKLLPYVKSEALFKAPDGKPMPLVFNSNLTGKRFSDVRRPAETVMMSLGGKGALVFKDGRTPIAFVDGHVKYLKPDQISILIWVP